MACPLQGIMRGGAKCWTIIAPHLGCDATASSSPDILLDDWRQIDTTHIDKQTYIHISPPSFLSWVKWCSSVCSDVASARFSHQAKQSNSESDQVVQSWQRLAREQLNQPQLPLTSSVASSCLPASSTLLYSTFFA